MLAQRLAAVGLLIVAASAQGNTLVSLRENLSGVPADEATPAPAPAPFHGTFCRGIACRLRRWPQAHVVAGPQAPVVAVAAGWDLCRGLGCPPGAGSPGEPTADPFFINCTHLLTDVAPLSAWGDAVGGLTTMYANFNHFCKRRVSGAEVTACPDTTDVLIAALAPAVRDFQKAKNAGKETPLGTSEDMCERLSRFVHTTKQTEVDLRLISAALPSTVLASPGRPADVTAGPQSPRGLHWRDWAQQRGLTAAGPEQPAAEANATGAADVPRRRPSWVGTPLFSYCTNQMREIMLGKNQTAVDAIVLTQDWCSWQATASTSVEGTDASEYGRPDWDAQTCKGMSQLMTFALRDQLDSSASITDEQACNEVFLAVDAIHRIDEMVKAAWSVSARSRVSTLPSNDVEVLRLFKASTVRSAELFKHLRAQQEAARALRRARASIAARDKQVSTSLASPTPPPLPNSDDFDPSI